MVPAVPPQPRLLDSTTRSQAREERATTSVDHGHTAYANVHAVKLGCAGKTGPRPALSRVGGLSVGCRTRLDTMRAGLSSNARDKEALWAVGINSEAPRMHGSYKALYECRCACSCADAHGESHRAAADVTTGRQKEASICFLRGSFNT